MIFAIGGVPRLVDSLVGANLSGAIQNGNYIGLALMIVTSLIAMYSLFRVMFVMYLVILMVKRSNLRRFQHRKGILGLLVAVVLAMGIAAPVILKVTENATNLNMKEHVFQENVNPHLKEVEK